jgi:hypothetical protein
MNKFLKKKIWNSKKILHIYENIQFQLSGVKFLKVNTKESLQSGLIDCFGQEESIFLKGHLK